MPAELDVLRRKAEPVRRVNRAIAELLDDMLATMYDANGVGLAAPQIGVSRRVIVIDVGDGPVELINPEIVTRSEDAETAFEGCLSIPDLMGEVERSESLYVTGLDRRGRKVWLEAEGWLARVIQHEVDHLDGILFLDRAARIVEIPQEKQLRIVFMGTPEFSVPVLARLVELNFKVKAVVTQPDRPSGRGRSLRPSPVKAYAVSEGLEILQPERASDPDFIDRLQELRPDVIVTCAFGMLLPKSVLSLPRLGCINVHASLLPKFRGAAPIQHAILAGERQSGITIFYMGEGMDDGDILLARGFELSPDETAGSLHDKLKELGAELLPEALRLLVSDQPPRQPQNHEAATYAPRLRPEDEWVDWNETAEQIARHIRAFDPVPGAATVWNDRLLKLFKPTVVSTTAADADPGMVLAASPDDGLLVAAAEGAVAVREVQPAGSRRMSVEQFLNGHDVVVGTVLRNSSRR